MRDKPFPCGIFQLHSASDGGSMEKPQIDFAFEGESIMA
jgi:hypothetical protein